MKPRDPHYRHRNVPAHRGHKSAPPAVPPPPPPPPGPRALLHARNSGTPLRGEASATAQDGPESPQHVVRKVTGRRGRPAGVNRVRGGGRAGRNGRRGNRRRVNWTLLLVRVAAVVLVAECAAALAWSPRLYVRKIEVTGNTTVPREDLVAKLGVAPKANILWLGTGKMRARVASLPPVESAEVHRSLPGTVRLVVRERTPWACVRDESTGICYTIDRNLVPFRESEVKEPGLPLIVLADGALNGAAESKAIPGRPWEARAVREAARCVEWAGERAALFPLEKVVVDARGKLCLNRLGGVEVRLGSGLDLDRKLETFSMLLARRTDLHAGVESQIQAVNLYAYDAPALLAGPADPAKRGSGRGSGGGAPPSDPAVSSLP